MYLFQGTFKNMSHLCDRLRDRQTLHRSSVQHQKYYISLVIQCSKCLFNVLVKFALKIIRGNLGCHYSVFGYCMYCAPFKNYLYKTLVYIPLPCCNTFCQKTFPFLIHILILTTNSFFTMVELIKSRDVYLRFTNESLNQLSPVIRIIYFALFSLQINYLQ